MSTSSKTSRIASDTNLVAGLQKHSASLPASFNLAGQAYTVQQCVTTLQSRITTTNAVAPASAAYHAAVTANRQQQASTDPFVAELKDQLVLWFKNDTATLADFGLVLPKTGGPKDPLAKVVGAEKMRATRKARGTMGKRQKEGVKGTIPTTLTIAVPSVEPAEAPAASNPAGNAGTTPRTP